MRSFLQSFVSASLQTSRSLFPSSFCLPFALPHSLPLRPSPTQDNAISTVSPGLTDVLWELLSSLPVRPLQEMVSSSALVYDDGDPHRLVRLCLVKCVHAVHCAQPDKVRRDRSHSHDSTLMGKWIIGFTVRWFSQVVTLPYPTEPDG